MIIICDECKTRFQLDVGLIKKTLFKVRCSKCKHVFSVDTSPKEDVYELALHHVVPDKKIIAICNQKGGVAKTSTCLNLGASLSLLGKRVLLIDFDVQANLTLLLGQRNQPSFYEVMQKDCDISKTIKNIHPNLWLLPANSKMSLLARQCLQQSNFCFFLRTVLKPIKDNFDIILIDTPPSIKFFTPNALIAADFVIIPTQAEFLAMNGVMQTENIIKALAKTHSLDYRVLLTMYDERNMASKAVWSKLKAKYKGKVFNTLINFDFKLQESQIVNEAVIYYDQKSISAQQYKALAKELEEI
jgi:chromosome partitioning protein